MKKIECPACKGRGYHIRGRFGLNGGYVEYTEDCEVCNGTGKKKMQKCDNCGEIVKMTTNCIRCGFEICEGCMGKDTEDGALCGSCKDDLLGVN